MGKREDTVYDHEGNVDVEATIDDREWEQKRRGEKPTQFEAPGAEQKWRARDLVDIHWKLVGIETPSESYNRIMSCIIGHANPTTGRCQLKRKLIAAETNYSIDTVKRAVKWWVSKKFLKVTSTGVGRSNAYHPQWELFELHWIAVHEDIEAQKVERPSTNSQPLEGPTDGEIQTIVSGYCRDVWDLVDDDVFKAAMVAEARQAGAGMAVITTAVSAAMKGS